ncbi:MAG: hypothetical protein P8J33_04700, partial [Pirellulaceae bacterium]|nr:hypothetical protein [Pirellulaceae bacterium]
GFGRGRVHKKSTHQLRGIGLGSHLARFPKGQEVMPTQLMELSDCAPAVTSALFRTGAQCELPFLGLRTLSLGNLLGYGMWVAFKSDANDPFGDL